MGHPATREGGLSLTLERVGAHTVKEVARREAPPRWLGWRPGRSRVAPIRHSAPMVAERRLHGDSSGSRTGHGSRGRLASRPRRLRWHPQAGIVAQVAPGWLRRFTDGPRRLRRRSGGSRTARAAPTGRPWRFTGGPRRVPDGPWRLRWHLQAGHSSLSGARVARGQLGRRPQTGHSGSGGARERPSAGVAHSFYKPRSVNGGITRVCPANQGTETG